MNIVTTKQVLIQKCRSTYLSNEPLDFTASLNILNFLDIKDVFAKIRHANLKLSCNFSLANHLPEELNELFSAIKIDIDILDLSNNSFSVEQLAAILKAPCFSKLSSLDLSGNPPQSNEFLQFEEPIWPSTLKTLNMLFNEFDVSKSAECIKVCRWFSSESLPFIENLYLTIQGINEELITTLLANRRYQCLDLTSSSFNDQAFSTFDMNILSQASISSLVLDNTNLCSTPFEFRNYILSATNLHADHLSLKDINFPIYKESDEINEHYDFIMNFFNSIKTKNLDFSNNNLFGSEDMYGHTSTTCALGENCAEEYFSFKLDKFLRIINSLNSVLQSANFTNNCFGHQTESQQDAIALRVAQALLNKIASTNLSITLGTSMDEKITAEKNRLLEKRRSALKKSGLYKKNNKRKKDGDDSDNGLDQKNLRIRTV